MMMMPFDALLNQVLPSGIKQDDAHAGSTSSAASTSSSQQEIDPQLSSVNSQAGGDLLAYNQKQWCSMHQQSEKNAELAEKVANSVQDVASKISQQNKIVSNFISAMKTLPKELEAQMAEINNTLEETTKLISLTESHLTKLSERWVEQELDQQTWDRTIDTINALHSHREVRNREFEEFKAQLALEHSLKIKQRQFQSENSNMEDC